MATVADTGPTGWAAFATETIAPGTVVATFRGEPCRLSVLERLDDDRRSRSIQIDDDLFLAGPPQREPGDCLNHSCDPNCGPRGAATIVARRPISPGEILTFDYATTDGSTYDEFACACAAANCRGAVRGTDWRRRSVQDRHRGSFSPYLLRRLRTTEHGRPLTKADVESLATGFDREPNRALADALRILLARPWSTLPDLLDALRIEGALTGRDADAVAAGDDATRDALFMRLVEERGRDLLAAFAPISA